MINRNKVAITSFVCIFIVMILWKTSANTSLWEWLASISLFVLVVHTGYGADQLITRFPKSKVSDHIIDSLILLSLLGSILVLPKLEWTNGFIASFYYFIGLRYTYIQKKAAGENKRYANTKLAIEAPLMLLFAVFSAGSVILPPIFTQMLQSVLLFFVMVIGSIWLYFFSGVYAIARKNIK